MKNTLNKVLTVTGWIIAAWYILTAPVIASGKFPELVETITKLI